MKTTYRGYTILSHGADGWLGFVYPPGTITATGAVEYATKTEGHDVLLDRARTRIDVELQSIE